MVHIRTTDDLGVMKKSLSEWEAYLANKFRSMECWHILAGKFFGTGAMLLAIALSLKMILSNDFRRVFKPEKSVETSQTGKETTPDRTGGGHYVVLLQTHNRAIHLTC